MFSLFKQSSLCSSFFNYLFYNSRYLHFFSAYSHFIDLLDFELGKVGAKFVSRDGSILFDDKIDKVENCEELSWFRYEH